jgi:polyisoprenoid-binding protein YceI
MSWQLDTSHSRIGFAVKHMMVSTVRGEFKNYTGSLQLDETDFTRSTITGEIEVASIDTRDEGRDGHLKSADFFDVENHPKMTFKSKRIEAKGDNEYTVYGDLTIRGVTREIAIDAEYSGKQQNPWGVTMTGFSGSTTINRKDFGLEWNVALETGGILVGEKVKLELEVELTHQAAPVAETATV